MSSLSTHTESTPEVVSSDNREGGEPSRFIIKIIIQQSQSNSKPSVHDSNHNLDPLKEENKHLNIASLFQPMKQLCIFCFFQTSFLAPEGPVRFPHTVEQLGSHGLRRKACLRGFSMWPEEKAPETRWHNVQYSLLGFSNRLLTYLCFKCLI